MRTSARLVLVLVLAGSSTASATAGERFKLRIVDAGVYGVGFEDLAGAGLALAGVPTRELALTAHGIAVPLWVEDGGDGVFGPGDRVAFVADRLSGEVSYYNETTPYNVYWLELGASPPWRAGDDPAPAGCAPGLAAVERHYEQDLLRMRFPGKPDSAADETWYWSRMTYLENAHFALDVDLGDRAVAASAPVAVTLSLRGWSALPHDQRELPDHAVEVLWNDVPVASASWDNGASDERVSLAAVPAEALRPGINQLRVVVPKRTSETGEALVDVSLANWVEVRYASDTALLAVQDRVTVGGLGRGCVELATDPGREVAAYRADGRRFTARGGALPLPAADDAPVWLVANGAVRRPVGLERDRPSDWRSTDHRADYLIVAHPTLAAAAAPLAEFHRSRGLEVAEVDVEDVYDEFGHGIATPAAIRDFVRYAWESWRRPAPRYVLLVGDASWDSRNPTVVDANYADWAFGPDFKDLLERFPKNLSTPYGEQTEANVRGLVPTWSARTAQGHAASDHAFVAFGEDGKPALAVGRFPVLAPEEVEAIVAKTIAYATRPPLGPWRARSLFITNETDLYQRQSDELAGDLARQGFTISRVYPLSRETSNEHHTQRLVEAFDQGQLLVHFLGHGGRYIWRTGPADFRKNHDLFTLEDLDRLAPTGKPAVVLSMSCYSAPFDHPNADSIGEKFLRLADKGAAAVIAASWRNAPSREYSRQLLAELSRPGATVGEALQRAKQQVKSRTFRDQYNLLGDPALPVALPSLPLAVEADPSDPATVRVTLPEPAFDGEALVEWRDAHGEVLGQETMAVAGAAFGASLASPRAGEVAAVSVYAWSERLGLDGFGAATLASPAAEEPRTVSRPGTTTGASPEPGPGGAR